MKQNYFYTGQFRNATPARLNLPFSARSIGHCYLYPNHFEKMNPRDLIQVFWCINGSATFQLNDKEFTIKHGQSFAYPKMTPHIFTTGQNGFEYRLFTIDGPLCDEILKNTDFIPASVQNPGNAPKDLFNTLEMNLIDISLKAERKASHIAYELLLRASQNQEDDDKDAHPIITNACLIIKKKYASPLFSIEAFANELNLHRSYFSRLFKNKMGLAPIEYLKNLRIQKGVTLLKYSNFPISAIAKKSGFDSSNYFSREIKKATGMSPREFKEKG